MAVAQRQSSHLVIQSSWVHFLVGDVLFCFSSFFPLLTFTTLDISYEWQKWTLLLGVDGILGCTRSQSVAYTYQGLPLAVK